MHSRVGNKKAINWPRTFIISLPIAIIFLAAILIFVKSEQRKMLSIDVMKNYGKVPAFSLVNQSSENITNEKYISNLWVANFIFTRCASICPEMTRQFKQLQESVPNVTLVSFSVDPEFDDPDKLTKYGQRFEAKFEGWDFLTGDYEVINQVAKGMHVTGAEQPMFHSNKFVLVDETGFVRGYYDSSDVQAMSTLKSVLRYNLKQ